MAPTALLVEDNHGDIELLRIALRTFGLDLALRTIGDGREALRHVETLSADPPGPYDLIILDLKLPRVNGIEVLAAVRRHPVLRAVPNVVFSSSDHPEDRRRVTELGGEVYLVKPNSFTGYQAVVAELRRQLALRAA